jgi:hypothetical protein
MYRVRREWYKKAAVDLGVMTVATGAASADSDPPKGFVSYSHRDKDIARDLAERLRVNGVKAWFDGWEIRPGDSLIEEIFENGLKSAKLFVILLSNASVQSRWVRHELDVAVVKRIEETTRIVPVLVEQCQVPEALRSLHCLNLQEGMDQVVRRIVDVVFDRFPDRPPVGSPPEARLPTLRPRSGLTAEATTLGAAIVRSLDLSQGIMPYVYPSGLNEASGLDPEQINDAVDELDSCGFLKVGKAMGTAPYRFAFLKPNCRLVYLFADQLKEKIDPEADVSEVAAAIASLKEADGEAITRHLNLPAARVNLAAEYLSDHGIIRVLKEMGTAPYEFGLAIATPATRRFTAKGSP